MNGSLYEGYLKMIEDNAHLISMVPVEELLRFGYEIGLNQNSRVLDLCCGYGTLLKVWSEAFGISGVGVDINENFLSVGRSRLLKYGIKNVELICSDVLSYQDSGQYDVVICSETIESIQNTLALGEKFLKSGGVLAYQKVYSKVDNPPKELVDFDLEVLPLSELNKIFNSMGHQLVSMASDTPGMWEHYVINWSGKRDLLRFAQNREDSELEKWIEKWYSMYFNFRRSYEGHAMFGLQRII